MMKISKRDQKLLLIIAGLVAFLAVYFGIYNTYNAKTAALEAEASALAPRLEELRGYYKNLSSYELSNSKVAETVHTELAKFPSDVRSEDMVMYATELEKNVGLTIDSISFLPPERVLSFEVPKETNGVTTLVPVAALKTGFSVTCGLNYLQFKNLVKYIYNTPDSTTLESVGISFNAETGGLVGNVAVSKFFVSSGDYVYKPTEIPEVPMGAGNPFGTFTVAPAPKAN
ncbi:MAG: hypothetical protein RSB39_04845 [Oscillospiraceae bacterium]